MASPNWYDDPELIEGLSPETLRMLRGEKTFGEKLKEFGSDALDVAHAVVAPIQESTGAGVGRIASGLANLAGALGGDPLAGERTYEKVRERKIREVLDEKAAKGEAPEIGFIDSLRIAPTAGELSAEEWEAKSEAEKVAKDLTILLITMATDPATWTPAGVGTAAKALRAKDLGKLAKAKAVAEAAMGSALPAAVYGPELATGVVESAKQAASDFREGDIEGGLARGAQAAVMTGLGGLMGYGALHEGRIARDAIREGFRPPPPTPPPPPPPGEMQGPSLPSWDEFADPGAPLGGRGVPGPPEQHGPFIPPPEIPGAPPPEPPPFFDEGWPGNRPPGPPPVEPPAPPPLDEFLDERPITPQPPSIPPAPQPSAPLGDFLTPPERWTGPTPEEFRPPGKPADPLDDVVSQIETREAERAAEAARQEAERAAQVERERALVPGMVAALQARAPAPAGMPAEGLSMKGGERWGEEPDFAARMRGVLARHQAPEEALPPTPPTPMPEVRPEPEPILAPPAPEPPRPEPGPEPTPIPGMAARQEARRALLEDATRRGARLFDRGLGREVEILGYTYRNKRAPEGQIWVRDNGEVKPRPEMYTTVATKGKNKGKKVLEVQNFYARDEKGNLIYPFEEALTPDQRKAITDDLKEWAGLLTAEKAGKVYIDAEYGGPPDVRAFSSPITGSPFENIRASDDSEPATASQIAKAIKDDEANVLYLAARDRIRESSLSDHADRMAEGERAPDGDMEEALLARQREAEAILERIQNAEPDEALDLSVRHRDILDEYDRMHPSRPEEAEGPAPWEEDTERAIADAEALSAAEDVAEQSRVPGAQAEPPPPPPPPTPPSAEAAPGTPVVPEREIPRPDRAPEPEPPAPEPARAPEPAGQAEAEGAAARAEEGGKSLDAKRAEYERGTEERSVPFAERNAEQRRGLVEQLNGEAPGYGEAVVLRELGLLDGDGRIALDEGNPDHEKVADWLWRIERVLGIEMPEAARQSLSNVEVGLSAVMRGAYKADPATNARMRLEAALAWADSHSSLAPLGRKPGKNKLVGTRRVSQHAVKILTRAFNDAMSGDPRKGALDIGIDEHGRIRMDQRIYQEFVGKLDPDSLLKKGERAPRAEAPAPPRTEAPEPPREAPPEPELDDRVLTSIVDRLSEATNDDRVDEMGRARDGRPEVEDVDRPEAPEIEEVPPELDPTLHDEVAPAEPAPDEGGPRPPTFREFVESRGVDWTKENFNAKHPRFAELREEFQRLNGGPRAPEPPEAHGLTEAEWQKRHEDLSRTLYETSRDLGNETRRTGGSLTPELSVARRAHYAAQRAWEENVAQRPPGARFQAPPPAPRVAENPPNQPAAEAPPASPEAPPAPQRRGAWAGMDPAARVSTVNETSIPQKGMGAAVRAVAERLGVLQGDRIVLDPADANHQRFADWVGQRMGLKGASVERAAPESGTMRVPNPKMESRGGGGDFFDDLFGKDSDFADFDAIARDAAAKAFVDEVGLSGEATKSKAPKTRIARRADMVAQHFLKTKGVEVQLGDDGRLATSRAKLFGEEPKYPESPEPTPLRREDIPRSTRVGTGGGARGARGPREIAAPGEPTLPGGRRPHPERIITARGEQTGGPVKIENVPEPLRKHLTEEQAQGAERAIRSLDTEGGFLLADGPGGGKTRQILAVSSRYNGQGKTVLVVAPSNTLKIVQGNKSRKARATGSYDNDARVMGLDYEIVPAPPKDGPPPPLAKSKTHLTTYERLQDIIDLVDKDTVLVFDEAHYLKNFDSNRTLAARKAMDKAHSVLYATATPADKPQHLGYLGRIGAWEGKGEYQALVDLGLRREEREVKKGKSRFVVYEWIVNPDVGIREVQKRMAALFDRLTAAGRVIKRELGFDGVDVQFRDVDVPPEAQKVMDDIAAEWGGEGKADAKNLIMHQRRQLEPYKVQAAVDVAKSELAEGRQVILFAERINRSDAVRKTKVFDQNGEVIDELRTLVASSEGTIKLLRQALDDAGIKDVSELHGESDEKGYEAVSNFQHGRSRVLIATLQSGGTGINLDDAVGTRPRTLVMITSPMSAMENIQGAGRVWRLSSESKPRIIYLHAKDIGIDNWNRRLTASKMATLKAAVAGEAGRLMPEQVEFEVDDPYAAMGKAAKEAKAKRKAEEAERLEKYNRERQRTTAAITEKSLHDDVAWHHDRSVGSDRAYDRYRAAILRLGGEFDGTNWKIETTDGETYTGKLTRRAGGTDGVVTWNKERHPGEAPTPTKPAKTQAEARSVIREFLAGTSSKPIVSPAQFRFAKSIITGDLNGTVFADGTYFVPVGDGTKGYAGKLVDGGGPRPSRQGKRAMRYDRRGTFSFSDTLVDAPSASKPEAKAPTMRTEATEWGEQGLIPGARNLDTPTAIRPEGNPSEGPLFTQERDARVREIERSQTDMFDLPPAEPGGPKWRMAEPGELRAPVRNPVDLSSVRRAFHGARVNEAQPGTYHVDLPNGRKIVVKTGQDITIYADSFREGYGRDPRKGDRAVGEFRPVGLDGIIRLAKVAGERTLDHETFHAAMEISLNEKERAAVLARYGSEEKAAKAYERWQPASRPDSLLGRIKDFFRRIYKAWKPDADEVFRRVKSGESWNRTSEAAGRDKSIHYQQIRRIRRSMDKLIEGARSQAHWKDWYDEHRATVKELFGEDADLFQRILSATSQRQTVAGNVTTALKAYDAMKRGTPFTGMLPPVIRNLERIREGVASLSGPKIGAYDRANAGGEDAIAIDRHVARVLYGIPNPTPAQIAKGQRVIAKVAERMGWAPRQVQAALWALGQVEAGRKVVGYADLLRAKADAIRALRSEFPDAGAAGAGVPGRGDAGRGAGEGARSRYDVEDEPPIPWAMSDEAVSAARRKGFDVLMVRAADLLDAAAEDINRPGRLGQKVDATDKLSRAEHFLRNAIQDPPKDGVYLPEVAFADGKLKIEDGAHRATAARGLGAEWIPVKIEAADAWRLKDAGVETKGLDEAEPHDSGEDLSGDVDSVLSQLSSWEGPRHGEKVEGTEGLPRTPASRVERGEGVPPRGVEEGEARPEDEADEWETLDIEAESDDGGGRYSAVREGENNVSDGEPPRVDENVSGFRHAVAEHHAAGGPTIKPKDQTLKRDLDRGWNTEDFEDEVRDISRTYTDENFLNIIKRRALTDAESQAYDARLARKIEIRNEAKAALTTANAGGDAEAIRKARNNWMEANFDYLVHERARVNDGTGVARALAARRRFMDADKGSPHALIRRLITDLGAKGEDTKVSNEDLAKMVDMWERGDPLLLDLLRARIFNKWDKLVYLWRGNLLSAVSTDLANHGGNAVYQGVVLTDHLAASHIDRVLSRIYGGRRARYTAEVGVEARAMLSVAPKALSNYLKEMIGLLGTMADAVPGALKAAKAGAEALPFGADKFVGEGLSRANKPKVLDPTQNLEYQISPLSGRAGKLWDPMYLKLGAADNMAKEIIGPGELARLSMREAIRRLGHEKGPDVDALAKEIAASVLRGDEEYGHISKQLAEAKQSRVFQNRSWDFVEGLKRLRGEHAWLQLPFPFLQTPAAIAQATLHHSPFGFLMAKTRNARAAFLKAQAEGIKGTVLDELRGRYADALSENLTGSAIFASSVGLAMLGGFTGGGPSDQKKKNLLRDTGWQPYSLVIPVGGGRKLYIPYNRLEPVGSVIGMAADMVEIADEKDQRRAYEKAIGSIMTNLTSKTYLQGIADFSEAWSDPDSLGKYLAHTVGSAVPNVVARGAQAIDPALRETRPEKTGLQGAPERTLKVLTSRLPFLSMILDPKRSPVGEPIERPGIGLTRFALPSQPSISKAGTEVESEMARIGYAPNPASRSRRVRGVPVTLTDEEYAVMVEADRRAASAIKAALRSPGYMNKPDTIEEGGSRSKESFMRSTYERYREQAWNRIKDRVGRRRA